VKLPKNKILRKRSMAFVYQRLFCLPKRRLARWQSRPFWLLMAITFSFILLPLAHAQWAWVDKDGRKVFSDQPPPSQVPDKDILKRPGGMKAPAVTASVSEATPTKASSSTSTTATAPKLTGKDAELEKKKKEAEAKEAAQKKSDAEKVSAAKKDNCERAKRAKASFDSGIRISTTNAQGEREVMSDATRATEIKRLQDIIASDCN
jgi:Domain of unknown function (DUF4124)